MTLQSIHDNSVYSCIHDNSAKSQCLNFEKLITMSKGKELYASLLRVTLRAHSSAFIFIPYCLKHSSVYLYSLMHVLQNGPLKLTTACLRSHAMELTEISIGCKQ